MDTHKFLDGALHTLADDSLHLLLPFCLCLWDTKNIHQSLDTLEEFQISGLQSIFIVMSPLSLARDNATLHFLKSTFSCRYEDECFLGEIIEIDYELHLDSYLSYYVFYFN